MKIMPEIMFKIIKFLFPIRAGSCKIGLLIFGRYGKFHIVHIEETEIKGRSYTCV